MSAYTPHGAVLDRPSRSTGEMPFNSHRLPPRMGAPAHDDTAERDKRRSVAREQRNYRLALAAGWASTVVIPAVVTLYHQAFVTMLGHFLASIIQH